MRHFSLYLCLFVFICGHLLGCSRQIAGRRDAMFEPATLRINPTFSRFRSFDADDELDGIETDVELRDRFGDPTKAAGSIYFELFRYVPEGPDVRGPRVGRPVTFDLGTEEAQRRHWQNVIRTYRFRLPWQELDPQASYVLSAVYQPPPDPEGRRQGDRLFDRLVVTPSRDE